MKVVSGWDSWFRGTVWYPSTASNSVFFWLGGTCSASWNRDPVWWVSRLHCVNLSVGNLLFFVACHFFFFSNYHSATSICGHDDGYWGYDTPFHVFPKGLSYWFFEVKRHRDWVMSGFGDCFFFLVDISSGTRHWWEFSIYSIYKYFACSNPIILSDNFQIYFCLVGWGYRIHRLLHWRGVRSPNYFPVYDTKHSDGGVQNCWSYAECRVPLHCHSSQVHSVPEW